MKVTISISGRYYDRTAAFPNELDLPPGATVDDALIAVQADRPGVRGLVPAALVAISGRHIGTVADHAAQALCDGDELFIFAPVAGG